MRILFLISVIALLVTSCASEPKREAQSTPPPPPPAPAATNATSVVQMTDANYDEVVRAQKVVLIFFWAPWSAPDRIIAPVIDAVAKDYSARVKTGKVNVDENPELARKFNIEGIPAVVVLKDGRNKSASLVSRLKRGSVTYSISNLIEVNIKPNSRQVVYKKETAVGNQFAF